MKREQGTTRYGFTFLLTVAICSCFILVGCSSNNDNTVAKEETSMQSSASSTEDIIMAESVPASESQTESSNIVDAENLQETFGILVSLPENANWIANSEHYLQFRLNIC